MIGRNIAEDKSSAAEMATSCAFPTGLGNGSERLPRPPRQDNRLAEGTWQMAILTGFRDLRSVNAHRSAMGHVRNARCISLLSSWLLSETTRGSRPARETTPRHAHRHRGIGIRSIADVPAFRGIRRFGSPGDHGPERSTGDELQTLAERRRDRT